MKRKKHGYNGCSLILRPLALARIEEEAKRRKVHTDDVLNGLFDDRSFREEFSKVATPSDLDVDDDDAFFGWVVSEFAMRLLPPSRRELQ